MLVLGSHTASLICKFSCIVKDWNKVDAGSVHLWQHLFVQYTLSRLQNVQVAAAYMQMSVPFFWSS